jgi:hypothetical protein
MSFGEIQPKNVHFRCFFLCATIDQYKAISGRGFNNLLFQDISRKL